MSKSLLLLVSSLAFVGCSQPSMTCPRVIYLDGAGWYAGDGPVRQAELVRQKLRERGIGAPLECGRVDFDFERAAQPPGNLIPRCVRDDLQLKRALRPWRALGRYRHGPSVHPASPARKDRNDPGGGVFNR